MTRRSYWRIVPRSRDIPDVYRRRFATRVEAEEVRTILLRPGWYETVEYTPEGKRCVALKPDGMTTIE